MEENELLQHYYKTPTNYEIMVDATVSRHEGNPICGDDITVYLKSDANDIITKLTYHGNCSLITIACSGFFSEIAVGKSIEELLSRTYENLKKEGLEVSSKRKRAATIALLATQNALLIYKGKEPSQTFEDILV
jgi:nitrogen fixation NifU-like protein